MDTLDRKDKAIAELINEYISQGYTFDKFLDEQGFGIGTKIRSNFERVYNILYPPQPQVIPTPEPILDPQIQLPLRPYQISTVAKCQAEFAAAATRCFIQLPTGAGKTRVMYKLIDDDFIACKSRQIIAPIYICMSPRISLAQQHFNDAKNKGLATPHSLINIYNGIGDSEILGKFNYWKHRCAKGPEALIISCCYQSINRLVVFMREIKSTARICFSDEAHMISHFGQKEYLDKNPDEATLMLSSQFSHLRVFLTATPTEYQTNNYNKIWGNLINEITVGELISTYKCLCPIKTIIPNISAAATVISNNTSDIQGLDSEDDEDNINQNELIKILYETMQKTNAQKAVIFCNTQEKCKVLQIKFNELNSRLCNTSGNKSITAYKYIGSGKSLPKTEIEQQDEILRTEYKKRGDILLYEKHTGTAVIFVCKKISMGYDFPPIDFIGFADPKCSRAELAQCIGRGLRISPATGKQFCWVFIPITPDDYTLDTINKRRYRTLFQYLEYLRDEFRLEYLIKDNIVKPSAATTQMVAQPAISVDDLLGVQIMDDSTDRLDIGQIPNVNYLDESALYVILNELSIFGNRTETLRYKMFMKMLTTLGIKSPAEYNQFIQSKLTSQADNSKYLKWPQTATEIIDKWTGFRWINVLPEDTRAMYYPTLDECKKSYTNLESKLSVSPNFEFLPEEYVFKKIRELDPKIPEIPMQIYYD